MMTQIQEFELKTKILIDDLKAVCSNYGLGNSGNEWKIITQIFLYKFLNDKFIYEVKKLDPAIADADDVNEVLRGYSADDFDMLMMQLGENTAHINPDQFITSLFNKQNESNFALLFDKTLLDIAKNNSGIFSVFTDEGQKIALFEDISNYVSKDRDEFCKAIINKIVGFSFENVFDEGKFDFYAGIFEYLIKDYNTDSGGTYAEYYTPHSVAKIMASCLVNKAVDNVTCYDPSAGSGTLLMNLAHAIGEDKCTIYSQDISQKSSSLLRLNLILNGLIHSIPNVVQGNTILEPYHKTESNKYDFIVANPPFKLDFSDYRDRLEDSGRFFAGVPTIPSKNKKKMAIYLLFMQHIINSLSKTGKAAIVVPTGFDTQLKGIGKKIRQMLVDEKIISGVISMPSKIFATTGTNVSIIFIDKENKSDVVLIDASNLGETVKDGKNQKTVLSDNDEEKIVNAFIRREALDDFSVVVNHEEIAAKNYSFSAGQYFDIKIDYKNITQDQFEEKVANYLTKLDGMAKKSQKLDEEIQTNLRMIKYE
tara:strand:+ start:1058 stop:2668 length:1611 start_codon:yes stop_codon:yes gene_type:complete